MCIGFDAQTPQFVVFALQCQMNPCSEAISILCMGRGRTNFWIELSLLLINTQLIKCRCKILGICTYLVLLFKNKL